MSEAGVWERGSDSGMWLTVVDVEESKAGTGGRGRGERTPSAAALVWFGGESEEAKICGSSGGEAIGRGNSLCTILFHAFSLSVCRSNNVSVPRQVARVAVRAWLAISHYRMLIRLFLRYG